MSTAPDPTGYPWPQNPPQPAVEADPTQPVPDPISPPKGDDGPLGETE